jgi:broad specificity phosphatase PhoE
MRHGEVHNPMGVLYGRIAGYNLSELGHEMAAKVAESLKGNDITHLVASPLERAQQTAKPISDILKLDIVTDDRVIEAGNRFEGKTFGVGDGSLKRPAQWRYLVNPFTPSWGEPYEELAERMLAVAQDVRDRACGHEAVCVSHQLPIWTLRRYVEGRRLWHRPDRRQCGLASLTSLAWDDDVLAHVTYSEPAGLASRRPGFGA